MHLFNDKFIMIHFFAVKEKYVRFKPTKYMYNLFYSESICFMIYLLLFLYLESLSPREGGGRKLWKDYMGTVEVAWSPVSRANGMSYSQPYTWKRCLIKKDIFAFLAWSVSKSDNFLSGICWKKIASNFFRVTTI